MDNAEKAKIVTAFETDFIMNRASELPKQLERFYRRRMPVKKPYMNRLPLEERMYLRKVLNGNTKNHWYYLGETIELAFRGPVYGPDKHVGGWKSYCILYNSVRAAALLALNLESMFFGRVKCYCIPYIERPWSDRPYTWIRLKVLFMD